MSKLNRKMRRERFTVADSWGSNRGETNSRNRTAARCSARTNKSARIGIATNAQNQIGAPKLIRSTASSWEFFPDGLRQYELGNEKTAAAHNAKRKQIAILLIFFDGHRRSFQLVDVVINLLERLAVGRTEKFSVGDLSNFPQTGFVKFHTLVLIKNVAERVGHRPARRVNRRGCDPGDSRADGVKVNFQCFHGFGRSVWRDFARVIFTVGEQNNNAAFRMLVVQS